ncbi:MAG: glycosyltransferase family 1 protein [Desulfovibrio sp.]|nr:MAG: glycosyltransferase family 1 protein [Desulfovibrio sp.]
MTQRIGLFLPKLSLYGGVERFSWDMAKALTEAGYDVDFVCARQEVEPPQGVNVIELGRPGPFKLIKMAWFLRSAEKARQQGEYDLSVGLGKSLNHELLRIGGGPLRNFWQLSQLAWPPGPARSWKMLRRRLSPDNRLTLWIEPRQLRQAKMVVAVSHLVRDWLLAAYPWLDPAKVRVIYNRPDPARFEPPSPDERAAERERLGLADSDSALLFAGANFRLKNLAGTIRALPLLPEEFVLLVAGGRRQGAYLKLAQDLGVASRVRFLGRIDHMPALYGACDVFALPTFYDACSNAVLEALACGVNAVSTQHNGSSFFLPKEHVLADPNDIPVLAQCIERAASSPAPCPAWSEDVACGMPAYLDAVRGLLDAAS